MSKLLDSFFSECDKIVDNNDIAPKQAVKLLQGIEDRYNNAQYSYDEDEELSQELSSDGGRFSFSSALVEDSSLDENHRVNLILKETYDNVDREELGDFYKSSNESTDYSL